MKNVKFWLSIYFLLFLIPLFGDEAPQKMFLENVISDQILQSIKKFGQCEASLKIVECEPTSFDEFQMSIYDPEIILIVSCSDFRSPIYITFPMPLARALLNKRLMRFGDEGESFDLLTSRERRTMRTFFEEILNNSAKKMGKNRKYFKITQITLHPKNLNQTPRPANIISFFFEIRIPGEKWSASLNFEKNL